MYTIWRQRNPTVYHCLTPGLKLNILTLEQELTDNNRFEYKMFLESFSRLVEQVYLKWSYYYTHA